MVGPLTVAIYIPTMDFGGVSRFAVNLATSLQREGVCCEIVADRGDAGERGAGLEFRSLEVKGPLGGVLGLAAFLRSEQPDVVVSNGWFADVTTALALKLSRGDTRFVSVTHMRPELWDRPKPIPGMRGLKRMFARWAYNRADCRIAVSRGLAEEMNSGGWAEGAFIPMYSPAVDDRVNSAPGPRGEAPDAPLRLAAMGWLKPHKGFDVLLRAMRRMRTRADVTIIGGEVDSAYATGLRMLATELGLEDRVHLVGPLSDPASILSTCDVFVFPSRSETFGFALVEAMDVGLPVVAADCDHGPREILGDGRFGTLVPKDDPSTLASVLDDLALDAELRAQWARFAREGATRFGFGVRGRAYHTLFASIARRD